VALGFLLLACWGAVMASSSFSFVPSSFSFGGVSGSSSSFLPVASGVVLVSASWSGPRDARGSLVVRSECGASFVCRFAGLPASARSPLASAVRAAVASGSPVSLLGCPGRSGRVCGGFFCGLSEFAVASSPEPVALPF